MSRLARVARLLYLVMNRKSLDCRLSKMALTTFFFILGGEDLGLGVCVLLLLHSDAVDVFRCATKRVE